jgi:hypothetical protein
MPVTQRGSQFRPPRLSFAPVKHKTAANKRGWMALPLYGSSRKRNNPLQSRTHSIFPFTKVTLDSSILKEEERNFSHPSVVRAGSRKIFIFNGREVALFKMRFRDVLRVDHISTAYLLALSAECRSKCDKD